MSTNGDMPAMPVSTKDPSRGHQDTPSTWQHPGLTKREHACIALRVPETGDAELDALIRTAQRRDVAAMAMQGMMLYRTEYGQAPSEDELARWSVSQADALLAALDASRPMEPKPKATGGVE
jgi:hypothetical protein